MAPPSCCGRCAGKRPSDCAGAGRPQGEPDDSRHVLPRRVDHRDAARRHAGRLDERLAHGDPCGLLHGVDRRSGRLHPAAALRASRAGREHRQRHERGRGRRLQLQRVLPPELDLHVADRPRPLLFGAHVLDLRGRRGNLERADDDDGRNIEREADVERRRRLGSGALSRCAHGRREPVGNALGSALRRLAEGGPLPVLGHRPKHVQGRPPPEGEGEARQPHRRGVRRKALGNRRSHRRNLDSHAWPGQSRASGSSSINDV